MDSIEQTARTVEEAVALALEKLNVSRTEVEVAILEVTTKSGILGFFGQPSATVRVTVKPKPAEPAPSVSSPEPQPLDQEGEDRIEDVPEELHDEIPQPGTPVEVAPPLEQASDFAAQACALTQDLLTKMRLDLHAVTVAEDERSVKVDIRGEDLGILIGKHGMHLNALQYLINVILTRKPEHKKVVLDGGGYRERREQALWNLAVATAEKVKRRGVRMRLGRLRADERRIIHMALQDDDAVQTYSEGEEPDRSLVIAPADSKDQP